MKDEQLADTERYRFHGSLHARPTVVDSEDRKVNARSLRALKITSDMLALPFARSFEDVAERLQQLPRMFFEPDGSFVWTSESGGDAWQLDGVLYDREGHLQFVDLRGEFTRRSLELFLDAVAGDQPVMFQLAREALFVDVDEFRRVCRV